jgi:hypothetical protein
MNSEDQAKASKIIERWFQGTITNNEFDDEWPWNSSDPAIRESVESFGHILMMTQRTHLPRHRSTF